MSQLSGLGRRFQKPEVIEQCSNDWDDLTGGANSATLWIRGRNEYFGCDMASVSADGFFNTYLPFCFDFLFAAFATNDGTQP